MYYCHFKTYMVFLHSHCERKIFLMTSSLIPFVDKVSIISWVGIWAESVTTLCYLECMKKIFRYN